MSIIQTSEAELADDVELYFDPVWREARGKKDEKVIESC